MVQLFDKIKDLVMSFTYKEKRNKQLRIFRDKVARYSEMDKDEINFEYINYKVEYEHKKNVLSLIIITIAISLVMNIWKKMFSFLNMAIKYSNNTENAQDTFIVCCIIASIIITVLMAIIIMVLSIIFNDLKRLKRELEIIEYIKQTEDENEN